MPFALRDENGGTVRGIVPLAEVFGYSNTLRSLSQGRGSLSLEPDRYLPVPREIAAKFQW